MLGKMYAFGARGKHQKQPLEKQEQDPEREKGKKQLVTTTLCSVYNEQAHRIWLEAYDTLRGATQIY